MALIGRPRLQRTRATKGAVHLFTRLLLREGRFEQLCPRIAWVRSLYCTLVDDQDMSGTWGLWCVYYFFYR